MSELDKRRVPIETGAMVAAIVVVKLVFDALSWEFIALSPLYTSILGGSIFVIGILVAGVLADYKESERMPAELTSALETLHEDARVAQLSYPEFDLADHRRRLRVVVETMMHDLTEQDGRSCLDAINDLSPPIRALEELGLPANYIVRLRSEQSTIRRIILRLYHVQRTQFVPSGYQFVRSIVALVIVGLLFMDIEPERDAVLLLALISYFFLFMIKLLDVLDTPFRPDRRSRDDVSLFLLREFAARMADPPPVGAAGSDGSGSGATPVADA
jgi:hypothetical protein